MNLTYQPAVESSLPALAALFSHAFTGYITGTVTMTPALLAGMIAQNGIDLNFSMIAYHEDAPVGFALIARQGWTSRIAAMGIVPEAQGKQVGYQLLLELINQARLRGDRRLELEAFEQNTRAVNLYIKAGFRALRRLPGYTISMPKGESNSALTQIDILDVARHVSEYGRADLPWQMSGTHLARTAPPNCAYRLDQATAIITDPNREAIVLRAVIVPPSERRLGQAARLISALWAKFPDKQWNVQAICPEEYGGFFEHCGFTRQELNQLQMRLELEAMD